MVNVLFKLIQNNAVAFMFVVPNLVISLFCQWFFNVYLGWTHWLSFLAYGIGAGLGFEFGVVMAMLFKNNFSVGKWRYTYALDKEGGQVANRE